MAAINYICDSVQAINFQKDNQAIIGHIISLQAGDTVLSSNFNLHDPEKITSETKNSIIGPLFSFGWAGGFADPISFTFRVSGENKPQISLIKHKALSNTKVKFKLALYDYDPLGKVYYKSLHTGVSEIECLIAKEGEILGFEIYDEPCNDIPSPKNYEAYLSVMPEEIAQDIQFATSASAKFAKTWGIDVGGA